MTSRVAAYVDVAANQLVISTVEGGTNTVRATVAFPTSQVDVGVVMKLRMTVIGTQVNVYLNDEDVRVLDGLETAVGDTDTLVILPAMAGGAA